MQVHAFMIVAAMLLAMSIGCAAFIARQDQKRFAKRILKYGAAGAALGLLTGLMVSAVQDLVLTIAFIIVGILTASLMCIFDWIVETVGKDQEVVAYYDDGTPPRFYITGDKHRNFGRVKKFCHDMNTRRKDVLIILGDSGFNYFDDQRDDQLKKEMSEINITFFCLYGNKEKRPENIGTYGIRSFCGGKVYYEPRYPNLYFAIDGETYTFEGKKYVVAGGAHSVDKIKCLHNHLPYYEDEMPNDYIKTAVEDTLRKHDHSVYGMMTHTCPAKYLPVEMFMSTRQNADAKRKRSKIKSTEVFQPDIDRSTEEWLDHLEDQLDYTVWFCGHYHIDKQIDKIQMLCHEIRPLHLDGSDNPA